MESRGQLQNEDLIESHIHMLARTCSHSNFVWIFRFAGNTIASILWCTDWIKNLIFSFEKRNSCFKMRLKFIHRVVDVMRQRAHNLNWVKHEERERERESVRERKIWFSSSIEWSTWTDRWFKIYALIKWNCLYVYFQEIH